MVLAELISYGSINVPTYVWQYRSENQQRSLLGTTNEFGDRRSEVDYNEYGQPYLKKILWDGSAGEYIESVQQSGEETEITLSGLSSTSQPLSSGMLGALVRFTSAGSSPYALFGRVTSVNLGGDFFVVEDPNGAIYTMLTTGTDDQVTMFDHHDANIGSAVHTAGLWTSNPSPGSGQTTFTIGTSVMPTHIVGWTLQPDARYPVFYTVTGASSNTVSVAGDITGTLPDVTETDVFYMLIPPVGVDKATGTLSQDPLQPTTRYLAFQYHYQPPVAGTEIESTTYGRQTADNLVGGYYCWNRRYDPTIGRWTTPDPAVRPWWNLSEGVAQSPTQASDPTGLCPRTKDGKRCSPEGSTETSIVTCPCTHGIGISDVQWDGKHRLIDGEMTCTVKCTCEGSWSLSWSAPYIYMDTKLDVHYGGGFTWTWVTEWDCTVKCGDCK